MSDKFLSLHSYMTKEKKNRLVNEWLFHIVVWAALLAIPFFSLLPGRPVVSGTAYLHHLVMVLSFMVVFYVNWTLLIERFLFPHRLGKFILWNLLLVAAVTLLSHLVFRHLFPTPPAGRMPGPAPGWFHNVRFLIGNSFIYLLVIAVCVAIRMTQQWYLAERRRAETEQKHTEAQLQHLRSQLNPHFLFNTLNNIYSLIQIDTDRAQSAVHDLSQLLRYVLYDSEQPMVPVAGELSFLSDYIALMQIRLPREAVLRVSFPENPSARTMAPMLFISLIENAFKHGISAEQPSFIDISVQETEDRLSCHIRNSNHPRPDGGRSGSGIGLQNLRARLDMIYPGRYVFDQHLEDDVFVSHIEIPL